MKRCLVLALWALAALALPLGAAAQERILAFDSDLAIQPDGSLLVTEKIRVRAEGSLIRRGIYRDFPTRYRDRYGNRVRVDFELLGIERDGRAEPGFIERLSNGVRINTGNDRFLPTPGEFTFTIRYRTNRQMGFFADHDELYWNVTGLGWGFQIDSASAKVSLPLNLPPNTIRLDGFTGRYGERGKSFEARSDEPGVARFRTTRGLAPGEGLTIVAMFPKGLVHEPTRAERARWLLRDNRGVLVALAGLILLGLFYLWRWGQVGRDPPPGSVFPRYQPPAGFAPGELRMMQRMGNDRLCFTADVVDMAVRGFLDIHQGEGKGAWYLARKPDANLDTLAAAQRAMAARLFRDGNHVLLTNTEAALLQGALAAHGATMAKRLKPQYYKTNGGTLLAGVLLSLVAGAAAMLVSGGNGIPALIALGALALVLHLLFAWLLKAPTSDGRRLLDEIAGLRMYLGVAERDELKSLAAPGKTLPALDAKRYEALLPYAMALGVEEAWTKKFTAAVGAAAAQQASPAWYHGTGHINSMGLAGIGHSLGSALTQQISASATPPGSSSGGGGGGFSGGGGGGGGGGGR